jgi:lipopolysaccharide biosynthesis glycosyltransferase
MDKASPHIDPIFHGHADSQEYNLICTGIDNNYLWPWMVSIFSASIHSQKKIKVGLGVIKGNFSLENLGIVQNFCNFLKIDLVFKEFTLDFQVQLEHLPKETYIRLLWMDELKELFLWLDSDTLPLPGWDKIFSYLSSEENEPTICAVADKHIIAKREKFPENLAYQRAGDTYFNAGVFLANPSKWREKRYDYTWKEVGANFKELGFIHHDQDILNYVLSNDKRMVPGKFNVIVALPSQIEQSILHFAGGPKPWHLDEDSHKYFTSIENLKGSDSQGGAFSGKNWRFEFENYKRHEDQLISYFNQDKQLQNILKVLRGQARKPLMRRIDKSKLIFLKLVGRKWL